ncbi:MAG: TonB-dependent receptor domain-containing protein [Parcubacteria group bacterium]
MLLGATALAGALSMVTAGQALAQSSEIKFDQPAQPLAQALRSYSAVADREIIFADALVAGRTAPPLKGQYTAEGALVALLDGTGLKADRTASGVLLIQRADNPQSGSAAGDGADSGTVQALVVTAQKREENIQDVPIAISAFTEKTLQEQKIEGGFDLLKAIPNVTFSKNNFTSYNFSIRGIGTKAVSATTDPGVAVSFNNIALLQNRLFEQEYFDIERVEVLRGPQGTLYGRNATAGVVNVITAKPDLNDFKGWIKGEVGNYHSKRLSAMVNVPLMEDKLAVRLAGALTDRQGYDFNAGTGHAVNGRDLWSGRVTVAWNPTDNFRSNLVWERFNEDDNRSRTGKQLCHRDDGPEVIGGVSLEGTTSSIFNPLVRRAIFSQGCKAGSLYDDSAFGTPNGLSYNFVLGLLGLSDYTSIGQIDGKSVTIIGQKDPYGGMMQSPNLREITSFRDPHYRAKADVLQLNLEFDLSPALTMFSQTVYNKDQTYSFQDYNRFNTQPIFTDTAKVDGGSGPYSQLAPGGFFCDPQLGCSNTMAGFDVAKAKGEQYTEELRLQSAFDGPLNFSAGATYTHFRTLVDYYVMFNLMTAMAEIPPFNGAGGSVNPGVCAWSGLFGPISGPSPVPTSASNSPCPYIDPNPIETMDGEGHNYFRSKNPYKVKSWGGFSEVYWNATETVKVTAGLRYSDDRKTFVPVPSQVLLAPSLFAGGVVPKGYPEQPPIRQHWGEWTGKVGFDWKPNLGFTDQTLIYASYSRGYKAGGANPAAPRFGTLQDLLDRNLVPDWLLNWMQFDPEPAGMFPVLQLTAVEYGPTFKPEFVNAFEVGSKNTLMSGALTLNTGAFFYDYRDYQVSQIRDRTAVNENFDAKSWGVEFETMFSPSRNVQIIGNFGYLDTKIADGEMSIDIMDRTQGDPRYVVVKPWAQLPSNCVVPMHVAAWWAAHNTDENGYWHLCSGVRGMIGANVAPPRDFEMGGAIYDPLNYPEINGGAGLAADLGGNELPNAPHWTVNLGAQYGHDFLEGWRGTIRGDAYWQSQSWARVYNSDPYDKLHGWYNMNLSLWLERPEDGLKIELYAKNILDATPITDAFLNSDDTGLTTNVFVLDPRLIGLSIRKEF